MKIDPSKNKTEIPILTYMNFVKFGISLTLVYLSQRIAESLNMSKKKVKNATEVLQISNNPFTVLYPNESLFSFSLLSQPIISFRQ